MRPSASVRPTHYYEIVHDRALAYSWRRYLGGSGPLNAALSLAAHLPDH
jgi:hypothetical protein